MAGSREKPHCVPHLSLMNAVLLQQLPLTVIPDQVRAVQVQHSVLPERLDFLLELPACGCAESAIDDHEALLLEGL